MKIYQSDPAITPHVARVIEFYPWPFENDEVRTSIRRFVEPGGSVEMQADTCWLTEGGDDCMVIFANGDYAVGSMEGVRAYSKANGHGRLPEVEVRP